MVRVAKIALVKTLRKVVAFIPKVKTSDTAGVVTVEPHEGDLKLTLVYPEAAIEAICPAVDVSDAPDKVTLSGSKLLSIVSSAGKEIRYELEDERLAITSDKSKWIEPMPKSGKRPIVLPPESKATLDVYPLLTAFNTVKYAVDSDSVRPALFMIDVKGGRVRACNGFQYHEVDTKVKDLDFAVPGGMAESFMAVLRHFDGEIDFYEDDDNYYFENGSDVISIRKMQLQFPDLDRLLVRPLKSDSAAVLQVNRDNLVDALKQVRLASDDSYPYVELHLSQKEVLLRCTSKMGSTSVASIDGHWAAVPRVATFSIQYLSQTLNSLPKGNIEVRFGTDTKKKKSPLTVEGAGTWTMLNQANLSLRA